MKQKILISLTGAVLATVFILALNVGLQKEVVRQDAQQESHCKDYGHAIDRWAERKGIDNPCKKRG